MIYYEYGTVGMLKQGEKLGVGCTTILPPDAINPSPVRSTDMYEVCVNVKTLPSISPGPGPGLAR